MGTPLPLQKGGGAPKFSAHVYCGQTTGWMKLVLGMELGLSPGDFVLDGDLALPPNKGAEPPSPIFGPFLLWPNGWMHQDATWYGCRPQSRGLCVRFRTSHPSPTRGRSPIFSASVYCGQTAGWIKMSLGMEIGLGLRDSVFDVDPATPRKKGTPTPPNFWPMSIVAKWLDG